MLRLIARRIVLTLALGEAAGGPTSMRVLEGLLHAC